MHGNTKTFINLGRPQKRTPRWKSFLRSFLRIKPICDFVFVIRYYWFRYIKRSIRVHADHLGVTGHHHNQRGLLNGKPAGRVLRLIRPLSVIDRMGPQSKVLDIGCRFESDLLYLVGYGFEPENVRGLDMFSYSPWVDLGNMHAMHYPDNTWDAVLLPWVLSYSDEPEKAAREVIRVTKPGGLIGVGVTVYTREDLDKMPDKSFAIENRKQTVKDILALFSDAVEHVYFQHDHTPAARTAFCAVIFSIQK
jgi:SAM-dependent methyltransferase